MNLIKHCSSLPDDDDDDDEIEYCYKCGHKKESLQLACINKNCKLNTSQTQPLNLLQNGGHLPQINLPNGRVLQHGGPLLQMAPPNGRVPQHGGPLPRIAPLNAAPLGVNNSINFKGHGNPIVFATAIVSELTARKLADTQGFMAETKTTNTQKKVAVQIRAPAGQEKAYNDTTFGLVVSQDICDRGKAIQAAQLREVLEKAGKQQAAVAKEGEERSRLLALRKIQLRKLMQLTEDKDSLENIDPEEAFEWHLGEMNVASIRELYRACTISNTNIAYFNGVNKSVAQSVSKEDCITYINEISVQDMKKELDNGDGKRIGVLGNNEEEEDDEEEDDDDEEKEEEEDDGED